jgi:hypothetical protein
MEESTDSIFKVEETLKMESPCSSKMVIFYQTAVLYISDDSSHVFTNE